MTAFIGKPFVGAQAPVTLSRVPIPGLSQIPVLGQILFTQDPVVYASFILVPVLWYFIYRTRPGLNLRAIGESPATADAMGVGVASRRYLYTWWAAPWLASAARICRSATPPPGWRA